MNTLNKNSKETTVAIIRNGIIEDLSNLRKKIYRLYPFLGAEETSEIISSINTCESIINKARVENERKETQRLVKRMNDIIVIPLFKE